MTKRNFRMAGAGLALAFSAVLAAADLPTGETILDKYIEVTGGKDAYSKIHSEITTGNIEINPMGMKAKMVSYAAEPDKKYMEMDLAGMGKMQEGSAAGVAWSLSAMQGPQVKEGDEKAEALLQSKFNSDLNWRSIFTSAETVGVEQVNGKDCYKVVVKPNMGADQTRWYDKESNLLVKVKMTVKSAMGEVETESTTSDYRKEGDILMAHKAVTKMATMELVTTVESVVHNPEIPAEKFDLPTEIKALLKK
jgi:hypothetical protein